MSLLHHYETDNNDNDFGAMAISGAMKEDLERDSDAIDYDTLGMGLSSATKEDYMRELKELGW